MNSEELSKVKQQLEAQQSERTRIKYGFDFVSKIATLMTCDYTAGSRPTLTNVSWRFTKNSCRPDLIRRSPSVSQG
jgi:hypothetical protein